MKIAKKYKTLLCDDIRQEVGGKISLMGIYGRDIVVAKTPITLPQIHFVLMLEDIVNPFDTLLALIELVCILKLQSHEKPKNPINNYTFRYFIFSCFWFYN